MEEFLLTKEPLNIIRISTALFVRVEEGEWTGILEKEVENFENVLKRVLEQVLQKMSSEERNFKVLVPGKN